MKRLLSVLLAVGMLSGFSLARDKDVSAVVTAIESQYGLHHQGIPWAVRAMMKPFMWGEGATLSVELFEDQQLPESATIEELANLSEKALGRDWQQFVRVNSRRDHEKTLIYAKAEGSRMLLLIVAAEAHETTVVKVKVNSSEAKDWIDDPETKSAHHSKRDNVSEAKN